ncbi:AGAP004748-PA [Anopheles gambiae str. PEST]|uniref:AGAP004748-PA n=4 Tax=gambiae species complex TaxID=44542 RepID=Q7PJI2_ANOGA|nr:AGAP004748-PA [Anopheles gambiae str. PEST]
MFRMQGLPPTDAAEEKRKVRQAVQQNLFAFVTLCVAIRIASVLMEQ